MRPVRVIIRRKSSRWSVSGKWPRRAHLVLEYAGNLPPSLAVCQRVVQNLSGAPEVVVRGATATHRKAWIAFLATEGIPATDGGTKRQPSPDVRDDLRHSEVEFFEAEGHPADDPPW